MAQRPVTIEVTSSVRNRLKTFGSGGESYSDILTHLLDSVDRIAFVERLRAERRSPSTEWTTPEEMGWAKHR